MWCWILEDVRVVWMSVCILWCSGAKVVDVRVVGLRIED